MKRVWEEDEARFMLLASEWHPENSKALASYSPGSNQRALWICSKNRDHTWATSIANRSLRGSNCPQCSGLKVSTDNSLQSNSNYSDLVAEWHPDNTTTPSDVSPGSNKKVLWRCQKDIRHVWEAAINLRVAGRGCPVCKGKKVIPGVNDLASSLEHQHLVAEWHLDNELSPEEVSVGSSKVVTWQCQLEPTHTWKAPIKRRTLKGNGCPGCSGHQTFKGTNDLLTTHPALQSLWHPTKNANVALDSLSRGSITVVWWQCKSGHEWQAPVYALVAGNRCLKCWQSRQCSVGEQEIHDYLTDLGFPVEKNVRLPKLGITELDLYLPDHNFAIEFNGVYWHSEAAGKGKDHHYKKQNACAKAGITLYQVWEDDWMRNPEVVLRGIAHRLGVTHQLRQILPNLPEHYTQSIGARRTRITHLAYSEAATFLEEHHIQGGATGTHYLGLVDPQERLRAVLVLKRTGKTGELSIERYATAGVVSGGFTKLLTYAEKQYQPQRWITFADLSLSDGGLYERTGFVAEQVLPPDYSYLVRLKTGYWQRVHKFNYRLKRFRDDPTLQYEEGLSERELAMLNGLHRIWDSGKIRYSKVNS